MENNREGQGHSPDMVKFDEGDLQDPVNWSGRKKQAIVANLCLLSFVSVLGSSIYAPGQSYLMEKYHIGIDLASSGLSFYVLGFASGPLISPLSELYGRKLPYLFAWPLMLAVTAPSAFANNIADILAFRYFAGCCSGCALNNGAGIIIDMYHNDPMAQAKAVARYTFFCLTGPCLGFFIGFLVAATKWNGFWVLRVHFFLCLAFWPLVFMLPESHGPTILARRARSLRRQGHDNAFTQEELEPATFWYVIQVHFLRPAKMLIYEPISQGAAIWIGLAYGIIYFFFEMYPVVFIEQHNMSFRLCGLMFLFVPLGMFISLLLYQHLVGLFARLPLPGIVPEGMVLDDSESNLKLVLSGCVAMPISLFWFAWSSGPETHWVVPALAGVAVGYCIMIIFMVFLAYMAQIYTIYSSSAAAANTFARSIVAAMFPIVTHIITDVTGTKWAVSIFGFLSLGLIPIPLIFIRYGKQLRARSRYGKEARVVITRMGEYYNRGSTEEGSESSPATKQEVDEPEKASA